MSHPWNQDGKITLHLDLQSAAKEQSLSVFISYQAFLILVLACSLFCKNNHISHYFVQG